MFFGDWLFIGLFFGAIALAAIIYFVFRHLTATSKFEAQWCEKCHDNIKMPGKPICKQCYDNQLPFKWMLK